ncbi:uncharacterized membrane protein YgdD (TMEM256/DUF423 family) [Azorhizobium sp. AG788]|uniref:DUF423 domain-containing protein n=1 Tax=Azorhizobium sp. AG788 TaxID=2183897 RepID=UPI00105BC8AD|nr:DUF423 domain-containing protein [Azorhizobium sp. AG788]TDT96685.1 uncharacterized membrane protein YgdD (TMEM256/DUF423 family) [Azorhizobium sp. AG788]
MTLWPRLLIVIAGLYGAGGVALAAVSAHLTGGASLAIAANFLLFHAAALVALAAVARQVAHMRAVLLVGASALALGALLFSGDLTLRALMEIKLLGGSAPFGGMLMIAGWLVVGASALFGRRA